MWEKDAACPTVEFISFAIILKIRIAADTDAIKIQIVKVIQWQKMGQKTARWQQHQMLIHFS